MAIFVDENTKVIYQGLTGSQGSYYGKLNREYGTQVVAGTHPKKAGTDVDGIPIYASVAEAKEATGATASCIFIPAPGVKGAVLEAAEAGMELIVAITEGVPAHDEAYFFNKLKTDFPNTRLLGPNCPGLISPGKCNIGITAGHIAKPGGPVGIVSRSGTLTYQALFELQQKDIGVTTCVGIGGDPVPGTSFIDCLEAFEADPDTKAVMMIGEIGGSAEEEAAEWIKANMTKPVSSYVAGVTAPPGKKMGHAGAIVSGGKGTADAKMEALRDAGVKVGLNPTEAGELMVEIVNNPLGVNMTMLRGSVMEVGNSDKQIRSYGEERVIIVQNKEAVGGAEMHADGTFEIELPAHIHGLVELKASFPEAMPTEIDIDPEADEVEITLIVRRESRGFM